MLGLSPRLQPLITGRTNTSLGLKALEKKLDRPATTMGYRVVLHVFVLVRNEPVSNLVHNIQRPIITHRPTGNLSVSPSDRTRIVGTPSHCVKLTNKLMSLPQLHDALLEKE